ncbi:Potassium voltage-gated channel protein eag [Schistosoma japonicum]|nr:Potassium voltage-gated channel protein eag [Schistosoma japonicum]
MAGSRSGLVAPQNIFLETVLRRFSTPQTGLLIANARIVDHPIIYVNENFTKMTNYTSRDMMHQNAICRQLHGKRTSINSIERLQNALDNGYFDQVEITLYKKNRSMIWVIMCVAPVENDKHETPLYLILFYDISPLRQPLDDETLSGSFSKFAKLARSVARNKTVLSQVELDDSLVAVAPIQSNSIPKYRQESPKTPPHVVLHYLTFKTAWDWIIFLLTGYTCIIIPYSVAFGHDTISEESIYFAMEHIVDIIFFIDIVLNFHTTFVGSSGAVISDPVLIRLNYLKGWFVVDLISSLPFGILAVFSDHTTIINLSSILKLARLLRLCRVLRKLDQYLEYVASILLIMLFCFILLAHWLACVWYLIGMHDLKDKIYHGWIIHLMNETTGPKNWSNTSWEEYLPSQSMLYMTSFYFTLSVITSIGFGNVAANTISEKIVSIIFMLIGALVYATIFGNVATILQQTHATRARLRQLMSSVKDFLRIHEVPKELAERVIDYVTSSWSITKGVDTQTVLNHCPKDMKADLCVHLYRAVFSEHPAFRLASESCLRALAVSFTVQHTAPGDLIFHQGESIDQLCFVVSGSLEVIQDDEIVAILSKGDIFGQPIFKDTDVGQSAASVRALTYCDLQCIKRDKLIDILKFYSQFAVSFSRTLVLSYNLRNRLIFRKISDVRREQELNELRRTQPPISSLAPDHPVRRLISRFCSAATSNLSRSSSFSSNEPRESGKTSAKSNDTSLSNSNPVQETTCSPEVLVSRTKPKLSWGRLLDVPKTTIIPIPTPTVTTTVVTASVLTTNNTTAITTNSQSIKSNTGVIFEVQQQQLHKQYDRNQLLEKLLQIKSSDKSISDKEGNNIYDKIDSEQETFHKSILQHIESLRSSFLTNIHILSSRIDAIDQRITRIAHFVNNSNNRDNKGKVYKASMIDRN